MNSNRESVSLVEAGLIVAIACVMAFIGFYVPLMGFVMILLPLPFVVLGVRRGYKVMIMGLVTASIILGMLFGIMIGLYMSFYVGPLALGFTLVFKKKMNAVRAILIMTGITLLVTTLSLGVLFYTSGVDIGAMLDESMKMSLEMVSVLVTSQEELNQLTETMTMTIEVIKIIMPVLVIMYSAITAAFTLFVTRLILKKLREEVMPLGRFKDFRYDQSIAMGTSVIMVLTLVVGLMGLVNFDALFFNVFLLFMYVFSVQGVAVAVYFLEQWKMPKGAQAFIVIMILLFMQGLLIFSLLGWTDAIFNFRNPKKRANQ